MLPKESSDDEKLLIKEPRFQKSIQGRQISPPRKQNEKTDMSNSKDDQKINSGVSTYVTYVTYSTYVRRSRNKRNKKCEEKTIRSKKSRTEGYELIDYK